ncbi:phosphoribulokinase [Bacillus salacetis]|uniref:Phosphoribulokinase n=1 Tax=Bacillus salacetis TaxID=2315464 RepID=A0A3A1R1R1_9BACI|nr:phosphoribulokinase [Bacillus salacetis]RIW35674.1 phosphoribulokinase [Bacillus salacetis]
MEKQLWEIISWMNKRNRRLIIGISGHGASGKTTFAQSLCKLLDPDNLNCLNTDTYIVESSLRRYTQIQYEYMGRQHQDKMTACHPAAHNVYTLERDIKMLKDGLDLYSIGTSYSKSTLLSSAKEINIIEGMSVAFTDPKLYDLLIYFYTDGATEFARRSIRDVSERGMDLEYLKKSHDQRRIQYEVFMHPYHKNFDIVIRNSDEGYSVEKKLI